LQVTTIGVDLAKNIFQVHGITEDGTVVFNRSLRRAQMLTFFLENSSPALSEWRLVDTVIIGHVSLASMAMT
jgi:hypothetical protein